MGFLLGVSAACLVVAALEVPGAIRRERELRLYEKMVRDRRDWPQWED